ncbi:cupin domain-containing protein [Acuticoccus sediminis]|uniref:cupin domain-containing protein n=1 Tax=Acuticoccus sediminis TaxID=2184697 RepID=UPI001CFC5578|nr:cupin domain-containing protein [Acuticoccus sediminis]
MAIKASATVQIDEPHVRVTRWTFEPGTSTGPHVHEYDYVVVPVIPGTLTMVDANGDHIAEMKLGESYSRPKGVSHDVVNRSGAVVSFVEIEMK